MTTIDDTKHDGLGTENKGQDIRGTDSPQQHGNEMSRKAQDASGDSEGERSTGRSARTYIQTGMASCMAWPRAIREEILERDSD